MDGRRRILRSLRASLSVAASISPLPAFSGHTSTSSRLHRARPRTGQSRLQAIAVHPATTLAFCALVLGSATGYGLVRSGSLAGIAPGRGGPGDIVASALGLGIETITIGGLTELSETDILAGAGISSRNSLLFLDAQDVRDRLLKLPLVRDAAVRKLYPSRVSIVITERLPYGLWQKDGKVSVVSVDGTPIDTMRDDRFAALPFVVGAGADTHLTEYTDLLEAAGDMRGRIKAGIRISDRRWDLMTTDGVTIRLPEENATAAMTRAAKLQRETRLFDKDIVSLDLRDPTRLAVRLSDDAGAARLEALAHKLGKGKA